MKNTGKQNNEKWKRRDKTTNNNSRKKHVKKVW